MELPYIYYPGYTARFDGMLVKTFETENGFLGLKIDANEKGKLEVQYTQTNCMKLSKVIAIITFGVCVGYVWKKH